MREFKVGKVYLDTDYNTEVKVEIIDIENNFIYFSGYEKTDFLREHNGFYQFSLDIRLEHLISGRYQEVLKIGDTFEYNGFVCKVLHQIDEKKWFRLKSPDNKTIIYEKLDNEGLKDVNHLYDKQEITGKEFIKLLENNAK